MLLASFYHGLNHPATAAVATAQCCNLHGQALVQQPELLRQGGCQAVMWRSPTQGMHSHSNSKTH